MAEWLEIRDGGQLLYDAGFCTPEEADALFAWLRTEVPWKQETIRGQPLPRLNAWFADDGLKYAYSGLSHTGTGWLPELEEIKRDVEAAAGTTFNSLLLNFYRDGQRFDRLPHRRRAGVGREPGGRDGVVRRGARVRAEAQEGEGDAEVPARSRQLDGDGRHVATPLAARAAEDRGGGRRADQPDVPADRT